MTLRGNGTPPMADGGPHADWQEPEPRLWQRLARLAQLLVVVALVAFAAGALAHWVVRLVEWGWWVG